MGMSMVTKAAERETRGPRMDAGIYQSPLRGFMDDLTITTTSHIQARWVLSALEENVSWARMKFKPRKSRSLVLKKGRICQVKLKVQDEEIPTLVNNPIKCLGKWFDQSLSDNASVKNTLSQAKSWMKKVDGSGLPGKYKAWIYQQGVLPRLMWLLLIYEVPVTSVEGLERSVSSYLRRWIGVPSGFTSAGLYGRSSKLQLQISSVVEEFKVAKCRLVMTLRDSSDSRVSGAGIQKRTGRKWSASTSVDQAESMLQLRDVVGNICIGRQGLGMVHFQQWKNATATERRGMVQTEVRRVEEDQRRAKAVELGKQGKWLKWELPERRLSWSELWRKDQYRIAFLLRSVYDTLPSPSNLHQWRMTEDPSCQLCGKRGPMSHILSGCQVALTQGSYRWRHDKVLRELAGVVEEERRKKRPRATTGKGKVFVKQGETVEGRKAARTSLLDRGQDWELQVDLDGKLVFPCIVDTTLRLDMFLKSTTSKTLIVVELTVPWEENCEEANERKSLKYADLMADCRDKGWSVWLFPVEVGCRGFPSRSVTTDQALTTSRNVGEWQSQHPCENWVKQ
ncbi:uncharacterized protein LOC117315172 [Pecten maximus]|uniref:uncharacterized protein LOC117315172 n=1 Tax=Pecten maximus TaxID=6579 RepID=UPI0014584F02|nr:uncharacterized protein LOC117315172 [Pecten maximus]